MNYVEKTLSLLTLILIGSCASSGHAQSDFDSTKAMLEADAQDLASIALATGEVEAEDLQPIAHALQLFASTQLEDPLEPLGSYADAAFALHGETDSVWLPVARLAERKLRARGLFQLDLGGLGLSEQTAELLQAAASGVLKAGG